MCGCRNFKSFLNSVFPIPSSAYRFVWVGGFFFDVDDGVATEVASSWSNELEALLVAEEIEAHRELVIDAMRDTYDLW